MDKLYLVIPAYNEESNIVQCIEDWYPIVERYGGEGSRLVLIDDGSKDSTYSSMLAQAKNRPLLEPLTKPNGGHGATVLYGYRYAIDHGADYIFQTDSDGQTNPDEFEQFWAKRQEYQAIIGSRLVRGDGKQRQFIENVVCFLLWIVFGVKVQDANAPFRLMCKDLLEQYIHRLPQDFNIPNIMFTTYFVYYGHKVAFLPITFKPRQSGTNSINIRKIIRIGWMALGDFYRLRREMH